MSVCTNVERNGGRRVVGWPISLLIRQRHRDLLKVFLDFIVGGVPWKNAEHVWTICQTNYKGLKNWFIFIFLNLVAWKVTVKRTKETVAHLHVSIVLLCMPRNWKLSALPAPGYACIVGGQDFQATMWWLETRTHSSCSPSICGILAPSNM